MEKENSLKVLNKNEVIQLLDILENEYIESKCGLDYNNALELTVALILAAQCTDKRVNIIRPLVFEKYPDVYSLAKANQAELEDIIHSCGFYKNKAKNIILMANNVIDNFRRQYSKYNGISYVACRYW